MGGDKNLHLHIVYTGIHVCEEVYKRMSPMAIISTMSGEEITGT
jgi:hypothetical protein